MWLGRLLSSQAKAFHPVFMDVLDILSRRVDGEYIRLKGDGKAFDSSVLNLDQTLLLLVPSSLFPALTLSCNSVSCWIEPELTKVVRRLWIGI